MELCLSYTFFYLLWRTSSGSAYDKLGKTLCFFKARYWRALKTRVSGSELSLCGAASCVNYVPLSPDSLMNLWGYLADQKQSDICTVGRRAQAELGLKVHVLHQPGAWNSIPIIPTSKSWCYSAAFIGHCCASSIDYVSILRNEWSQILTQHKIEMQR